MQQIVGRLFSQVNEPATTQGTPELSRFLAQKLSRMFAESGRRGLKNSAILLVQCPDRRGLDAALADFIFQHNGNILHFEEHQVGEKGFYLARVEWDLNGFRLDVKEFPQKFAPVAEKFAMQWRLALGSSSTGSQSRTTASTTLGTRPSVT